KQPRLLPREGRDRLILQGHLCCELSNFRLGQSQAPGHSRLSAQGLGLRLQHREDRQGLLDSASCVATDHRECERALSAPNERGQERSAASRFSRSRRSRRARRPPCSRCSPWSRCSPCSPCSREPARSARPSSPPCAPGVLASPARARACRLSAGSVSPCALPPSTKEERWRDGSPATSQAAGLRDHADVCSLRALVALLRFVADLLTLGQGLVSLTLDRAEVDEQILPALVGRDESVALLAVEPLD